MHKKQPQNVYWMVRDPSGDFLYYCSRHTRSQCISDFVRDCQAAHREPPYTPSWADLRKEGYRVARVEIRPVR